MTTRLFAVFYIAFFGILCTLTVHKSFAEGTNADHTNYVKIDLKHPEEFARNNFFSDIACRVFMIFRNVMIAIAGFMGIIIGYNAIFGKTSIGIIVTFIVATMLIFSAEAIVVKITGHVGSPSCAVVPTTPSSTP